MTRDESISSIRPIVITSPSDGIEQFQNEVLRPILKFQHPVTQHLLAHSKQFLRQQVSLDNRSMYAEQIQKYLNSDRTFRNQLIGLIIGLMSAEELGFYSENSKELNKRIITMQVKRYVDTQFAE